MKHRFQSVSEPQQALDYTLRLMGNSVPQQFKITPSTRHGDMSLAGSQSGCLPSARRNRDPNHTPPCTAGQPRP